MMILPNYFSIRILIVPHITDLLSFYLPLVPLQFLDVDRFLVNFISSRRHLFFNHTNYTMFFSFLRHLIDQSTPYLHPELLAIDDDEHIYFLRK
jgi:hypothetical protein